ncbi:MAG: hypothetical protein V4447_10660 [Pseudomonadota bacterium]
MKIDKSLNLVCPIETESGIIYVHSTPLRREVFEKYCLVIAKTFAVIYNEGMNLIAGPRVAAMMLKQLAIEASVWEGAEGVENGLMAEIYRLSNVLVITDQGWRSIPLVEAIKQGYLSENDVSEIEGSIVFFICVSAMHKRSQQATVLNSACSLWETEVTFLSCTEYRDSLPISTETETFVETVTQSSLPG